MSDTTIKGSLDKPLLSVTGLSKTYPTVRGGMLKVLDDLDLVVERGEIVAVIGESGSGKSTLLHILGALDRPDQGSIVFSGQDVFDRTDEQLSAFRNQSIGFVFQFHHLLPEFNALENVMMPAIIRRSPRSETQARAGELLDRLGLTARSNHRPSELSGGEKQRVAMARALMNEPELVLADEPTGNLDTATADRLHNEIIRLGREMKQTFIMVTHNPGFAALADRVVCLENGKLASVNRP